VSVCHKCDAIDCLNSAVVVSIYCSETREIYGIWYCHIRLQVLHGPSRIQQFPVKSYIDIKIRNSESELSLHLSFLSIFFFVTKVNSLISGIAPILKNRSGYCRGVGAASTSSARFLCIQLAIFFFLSFWNLFPLDGVVPSMRHNGMGPFN
jgi:hypothetical protein